MRKAFDCSRVRWFEGSVGQKQKTVRETSGSVGENKRAVGCLRVRVLEGSSVRGDKTPGAFSPGES
jgi:hypothetical protein